MEKLVKQTHPPHVSPGLTTCSPACRGGTQWYDPWSLGDISIGTETTTNPTQFEAGAGALTLGHLHSKQNNFILVSLGAMNGMFIQQHFTAVNHDFVRQIIKQLEQLSVKKLPCLEMRAKKKRRQRNTCRFFSFGGFSNSSGLGARSWREEKEEGDRWDWALSWARHTKMNSCPCEYKVGFPGWLILFIQTINQKPTENTNYTLFGLWGH